MEQMARAARRASEPNPRPRSFVPGVATGGEAAPAPASVKACHSCARVEIGTHYRTLSPWRVFVGLPFVYLPILTMPFILLGGLMVYVHLRIMGARDLKTLGDFLPPRESHRYRYKTQILPRDIHPLAYWARTRAYWVFNCTLYCPFSVAALEWTTYLTKVVENWWCPFAHAQKPNYAGSAIDHSFWHVSRDVAQLHPEDRDNSIWNRDAAPR